MLRKTGSFLLVILCLILILIFITTAIREASWTAYMKATTAVLMTWLLLSTLRKKRAEQESNAKLGRLDKIIIATIVIIVVTLVLPALFLLARDASIFM
jgi:hydrogenase-4 membrane subunit HyfE